MAKNFPTKAVIHQTTSALIQSGPGKIFKVNGGSNVGHPLGLFDATSVATADTINFTNLIGNAELTGDTYTDLGGWPVVNGIVAIVYDANTFYSLSYS
jgi:hypothetical protein